MAGEVSTFPHIYRNACVSAFNAFARNMFMVGPWRQEMASDHRAVVAKLMLRGCDGLASAPGAACRGAPHLRTNRGSPR